MVNSLYALAGTSKFPFDFLSDAEHAVDRLIGIDRHGSIEKTVGRLKADGRCFLISGAGNYPANSLVNQADGAFNVLGAVTQVTAQRQVKQGMLLGWSGGAVAIGMFAVG